MASQDYFTDFEPSQSEKVRQNRKISEGNHLAIHKQKVAFSYVVQVICSPSGVSIIIRAMSQENLFSELCDQVRLKLACSATEAS